MSDVVTPVPGGKEPRKPWQYVLFAVFCAIVAFGLWLLIRNIDWRHRGGQTDLGQIDTRSPGGYHPVEIEKASVSNAFPHTEAKKTLLEVPDETADFDAPLANQQYRGPPPPQQHPAAKTDDQAALAETHSGSLLLPTATAARVPHPEWTVPNGMLVPCSQVTAIDTNSGGNILVQATIDQDVWSYGRKNVLIDKGSTVLGELSHGLVNGLDRLAVVWREVTTPWPNVVTVSLDSPAAGPLGEGGLDGDVNRHEWQKIKGVVWLSLLRGGIDIATSAVANATNNNHGGQTFNFGSFGSQTGQGLDQAAYLLLQSQLQIPDTIHRDQGLACSIFLARRLDFSKVYADRVVH